MNSLEQIKKKYQDVYLEQQTLFNIMDGVCQLLYQTAYNDTFENNQQFLCELENRLKSWQFQYFLPYDDELMLPKQLIPDVNDKKFKDYKCQCCSQYMTQIIIIKQCGCTICRRCMYDAETTCPACDEQIQDVEFNEEMTKNIQSQKFKCPFSKCTKQGTYDEVLDHALQCECQGKELQKNAELSQYLANTYKRLYNNLIDTNNLFYQEYVQNIQGAPQKSESKEDVSKQTKKTEKPTAKQNTSDKHLKHSNEQLDAKDKEIEQLKKQMQQLESQLADNVRNKEEELKQAQNTMKLLIEENSQQKEEMQIKCQEITLQLEQVTLQNKQLLLEQEKGKSMQLDVQKYELEIQQLKQQIQNNEKQQLQNDEDQHVQQNIQVELTQLQEKYQLQQQKILEQEDMIKQMFQEQQDEILDQQEKDSEISNLKEQMKKLRSLCNNQLTASQQKILPMQQIKSQESIPTNAQIIENLEQQIKQFKIQDESLLIENQQLKQEIKENIEQTQVLKKKEEELLTMKAQLTNLQTIEERDQENKRTIQNLQQELFEVKSQVGKLSREGSIASNIQENLAFQNNNNIMNGSTIYYGEEPRGSIVQNKIFTKTINVDDQQEPDIYKLDLPPQTPINQRIQATLEYTQNQLNLLREKFQTKEREVINKQDIIYQKEEQIQTMDSEIKMQYQQIEGLQQQLTQVKTLSPSNVSQLPYSDQNQQQVGYNVDLIKQMQLLQQNALHQQQMNQQLLNDKNNTIKQQQEVLQSQQNQVKFLQQQYEQTNSECISSQLQVKQLQERLQKQLDEIKQNEITIQQQETSLKQMQQQQLQSTQHNELILNQQLINQLKQQLNEKNDKISTLQLEIQQKYQDQELSALTQCKFDTLNQEINQLKQNNTQIQEHCNYQNTKLQQYYQTILQQNNQMQTQFKEMQDLKMQNNELINQMDQHGINQKSLQNKNQEQNEVINNLQQNNAKLLQQNEQINNELNQNKLKIESIKQEQEQLIQQYDIQKQKEQEQLIRSHQQQLNEQNSLIQQLKEQQYQQQATTDVLKQQASQAELYQAELQQQLEQLQTDYDNDINQYKGQLMQQLDDNQQLNNTLSQQIIELQEKIGQKQIQICQQENQIKQNKKQYDDREAQFDAQLDQQLTKYQDLELHSQQYINQNQILKRQLEQNEVQQTSDKNQINELNSSMNLLHDQNNALNQQNQQLSDNIIQYKQNIKQQSQQLQNNITSINKLNQELHLQEQQNGMLKQEQNDFNINLNNFINKLAITHFKNNQIQLQQILSSINTNNNIIQNMQLIVTKIFQKNQNQIILQNQQLDTYQQVSQKQINYLLKQVDELNHRVEGAQHTHIEINTQLNQQSQHIQSLNNSQNISFCQIQKSESNIPQQQSQINATLEKPVNSLNNSYNLQNQKLLKQISTLRADNIKLLQDNVELKDVNIKLKQSKQQQIILNSKYNNVANPMEQTRLLGVIKEKQKMVDELQQQLLKTNKKQIESNENKQQNNQQNNQSIQHNDNESRLYSSQLDYDICIFNILRYVFVNYRQFQTQLLKQTRYQTIHQELQDLDFKNTNKNVDYTVQLLQSLISKIFNNQLSQQIKIIYAQVLVLILVKSYTNNQQLIEKLLQDSHIINSIALLSDLEKNDIDLLLNTNLRNYNFDLKFINSVYTLQNAYNVEERNVILNLLEQLRISK